MAKRTKEVYNNDQLPHIWVHGNQDYGRTPNSRMYFQGKTIYSYGSHFPIARKVENKKGQTAYLVTTRSYSNTTHKHQSAVNSAIPHNAVKFWVNLTSQVNYDFDGRYEGSLNNAHKAICDEFKAEIKSMYDAAMKGSKALRLNRFTQMKNIQSNALEYAKFFGLREKFKLPISDKELEACHDELFAAAQAHHAKVTERARIKRQEADRWWAEREERQAKEAEEWAKDNQEKIAQWRSGNLSNYQLRQGLPVMLRIVGEDVETSRGAKFPVSHATKALKLVRSVVASGEDWEANGHTCKLGIYAIDKILKDGTVYAGCHIVKLDEIERLALELNHNNEVQA